MDDQPGGTDDDTDDVGSGATDDDDVASEGAVASGGDGTGGDEADGDDLGGDEPDAFDDHRPCPECGEALPADARFCPYCETAIDEDGAAVDLSDLEGFDPDGVAELLTVEDGERRASGRVRALAGLAVAVPLAPLVLFLVNSVVSLSLWTAPVVFLAAWLCCAALLSRAPVPVLAFGRSLYLLALGTALIPVALVVGDAGFAAEPGDTAFRAVALGSVAIAGVFLWLGRYVSAQGRRRVTGERRAFEDLREE